MFAPSLLDYPRKTWETFYLNSEVECANVSVNRSTHLTCLLWAPVPFLGMVWSKLTAAHEKGWPESHLKCPIFRKLASNLLNFRVPTWVPNYTCVPNKNGKHNIWHIDTIEPCLSSLDANMATTVLLQLALATVLPLCGPQMKTRDLCILVRSLHLALKGPKTFGRPSSSILLVCCSVSVVLFAMLSQAQPTQVSPHVLCVQLSGAQWECLQIAQCGRLRSQSSNGQKISK